MQVRHILQGKGRDVVAIASTATICDAAKLLTEKKIGALIVKDKSGKLSGIISERDLVRAMAKGGADSFTDPVSAHMTPAPETCVENDTVESVMEVMTRGRFRHVPVLDGGEAVCGMVSIGDVVKTRIQTCPDFEKKRGRGPEQSILTTAHTLLRREGFYAFYRGLGV